MKRLLLLLFSTMILVVGCEQKASTSTLEKVGLLVPVTVNDPIWGSKGYKGLLQIQSTLGVDVVYKEGIKTKEATRRAIEEFSEQGVNLIFGHGSEYEPFFEAIHKDFPKIHFVYFNGDFTADNVTSLTFKAHAMGFFGGMVAAKMSETKKLGIIAAYNWQPEVEGFIEGATYQIPNIDVFVEYTHDWDDVEGAKKALDKMLSQEADVFYPAGDSYNHPVIERVKKEEKYVIGFISDQSYLGKATVLTSTVQHVDKLYLLAAKQFINGELKSGIQTYDFQDGVITMGKYSPEVPKEFQQKINQLIEEYIQTGRLPNET